MGTVLIALPNDTLGGAEQHLKNLAIYYLDKGFTVHVFFLTKEKTLAWRNISSPNIKLHFTKSKKESSGIPYFVYNIWEFKNKRVNYVFTSHVHLTSFMGVLIQARVISTQSFIGRESTSIFKRFSGLKLEAFKFMYKLGYSKLDLLICQTEYMKNQLYQGMPNFFRKINIQVIPNPIDLTNAVYAADSSINFRYNDSKFIVAAGRLIHEKGFDILINSFSMLIKDFSGLQLIIIGEGSKRNELEELIIKLNLKDKVILPGFQKQVYPYFKYAEACVVSSRIEGFPNVLLQMMSQNTKVVSTLCAGGIDELEELETVDTENINDLYYKIKEVISKDTSYRRDVYDRILNERSVENFIKKLNNYLK